MQNEKVANYVKTSNSNLPEYKFGSTQVLVQSPLPKDINLEHVFYEVNNALPEHFVNLVDVVYIGKFDFLKVKNFNAMYSDGALYISNEQDNNSDFKDDIVHEIAHAVEEKYKQFLYEDESIQNEYFGKMKKLKNYMSYDKIDIRGVNFFNTEYNEDFDNFIYSGIGYQAMSKYTSSLFLAPYSITSLKEYYARAFEEFFLGNKAYLKTICPYVYIKITLLSENNVEITNYEY